MIYLSPIAPRLKFSLTLVVIQSPHESFSGSIFLLIMQSLSRDSHI